jgi:hypothetical protein
MKWCLPAALSAVLLLSGCGGSDGEQAAAPVITTPGSGGTPGTGTGDGDASNGGITPTPTDIGLPMGAAVSTTIGAAGGELASADGAITVIVPAGAFATNRTVSIQEITNEAQGAQGRAFRITPEGLNTPIPMTVRLRYADADLLGTTLAYMSIAYQDANRIWRVYKTPTVDAVNRTISVQTTHFSDWSMVAGVQLLPHSATVQVGQSLELLVLHCEQEEDESEDELVIPIVGYECAPSPLNSFSSSNWSVNGATGGGGQFGTIVANADRWSGKATYTAPTVKPTNNVVSVSAQHELLDGFQLLVANITIEDAPPSCAGLQTIQRFNAELSFDSFGFTATAIDHSHTGTHAGRLMGTLQKLETGPTFGFWITYLTPLTGGQVSINDSYEYTPPSGDGYTGTINGSGAPHDNINLPSFIGLKVNYATCTFDLFGSFIVAGTVVHDGNVSNNPIGVGGLYLFAQPILLQQGSNHTLQGSLAISAINNVTHTGYAPLQITATEWTMTGNTTARWSITPAD